MKGFKMEINCRPKKKVFISDILNNFNTFTLVYNTY